MINPKTNTLRRRSIELDAAGKREAAHDPDCRALFAFYAAECGLKAAYMQKNNLKHTEEERGGHRSAFSFGHRLDELIAALQIPAAALGQMPRRILKSAGSPIAVKKLHEAWRYGEKVEDTILLADWLEKLVDWARKNV